MSSRRALISGAAASVSLVVGLAALVAGQSVPTVEAQIAPTPATVPDQVGGSMDGAPTLAATPAAPPPPPIDANGATTTSLGGSDIAVSSVGGSYEVDGPARKARKANRKSGSN